MTAWDELIAKSTAVVGSDAWTHLVSDLPGGPGGPGETILLEGPKSMELALAPLELTVASTAVYMEVGEQGIAMVESSSDMTIDIDDGEMTIGD